MEADALNTTFVHHQVIRANLRTGEQRLVHAVVETPEDALAKAEHYNGEEAETAIRLNLPGPEYRYHAVEVTETRRVLTREATS